MKKVLYADYLFHYGIRNLNASFAKTLSSEYCVFYCTNEDYIHSDRISMIYDSTFCQTKGKFRIASRIILNAMKIKLLSDKIEPDYVVVGAYETRTLNIILKLFRPKAPLILMENNNIDQLKNTIYLKLYKKTMNSVYHIALEDYIEDYMVSEIGVSKDRVFTIRHPCYDILKESSIKMSSKAKKYNIIALSDSNDETFVGRFIESYDPNIYKNIRIYIKSKKYSYKSENLIIGSEYLSDQMYKKMFYEADVVLLPFPKDYTYRISGNLIDSISNGKLVIATPFAFAQNVKKKYPNLVRIISSPEELFSAYMFRSTDSIGFNDDVSSFKMERNEQRTLDSFNDMFSSIDMRRM